MVVIYIFSFLLPFPLVVFDQLFFGLALFFYLKIFLTKSLEVQKKHALIIKFFFI